MVRGTTGVLGLTQDKKKRQRIKGSRACSYTRSEFSSIPFGSTRSFDQTTVRRQSVQSRNGHYGISRVGNHVTRVEIRTDKLIVELAKTGVVPNIRFSIDAENGRGKLAT